MNTSRAGSRSSWPSNQASRASATSGLSCSAACAVFFERDAARVEEAPDRGGAGVQAALVLEAGSDLLEREIGCAVDQFEQIVGLIVELGARRMALALGRPLAGVAGAACPGDGRGGADAEAGCRASRRAAKRLIEDAFAQILAVRACHGRLPSSEALNHVTARLKTPNDSKKTERALASRSPVRSWPRPRGIMQSGGCWRMWPGPKPLSYVPCRRSAAPAGLVPRPRPVS